jgi:ferredoxin
MKVHILDGCIACGACEAICPDVFTVLMNAEVRPEGIPGHEPDIREASATCPVSVIQVLE